MKQSSDQGLFSCGIFVDLQKAFDAVDHEVLLGKLEHHEIRKITNKWFEAYPKACVCYFLSNFYFFIK